MKSSGQSVAIIGAGPGGLAAAVLLASSGAKVTVFESQDRIGGRTARITARGTDGGAYHFDTGPTFFMMPYVLEEVFAAAGRRLGDYVELKRLDPMYRLLMIGRGGDGKPLTIDTTQDIAEMSRRLAKINQKDGENFPRFIADNRYKLRHSESILRNPIRSPLDLFGKNLWLDTLKVGPVLRPDLSVHQLLGKYFTDPATKLAVSFQSKYLGMSPYDCPSLFTILPFIEYEYGVWHPMGGCNALMQAMADVAVEYGAEIRTGTPVEKIEFQGQRASGVVTGGRTQSFDHVVINADATWAMKKLIPENVRAAAGRSYADGTLDTRKYSCSTFMLYLGVEGKVNLPHHTICIAENYEGNLDQITRTGALPQEPSFYVCNPSGIDPSLAPEGNSALYVLVPIANLQQAGAAGVQWPKEQSAYRELAIKRMESVLGESALGKNFRERIRAEVMYTPETWKGMNINFGATFNLAHNLGQMLHKRPQNKLPFAENVYLVGGGTHPGSGLPTIFLSSQISSRMLCAEAGLPFAGDAARQIEVKLKKTPEAAAMV
ncbi:MAG: phytoene desaturase [Planctomycetes bacterium]|nr:phytoene desaturase [Planctomycetota bacterium]